MSTSTSLPSRTLEAASDMAVSLRRGLSMFSIYISRSEKSKLTCDGSGGSQIIRQALWLMPTNNSVSDCVERRTSQLGEGHVKLGVQKQPWNLNSESVQGRARYSGYSFTDDPPHSGPVSPIFYILKCMDFGTCRRPGPRIRHNHCFNYRTVRTAQQMGLSSPSLSCYQ